MSSSGSGDGGRGGRRPAPRRPSGGQRPPTRPAPRRPSRAPAPEPAWDEDATQAFNVADFDFDFDSPDLVDEDESTVSVDSAALRARASRAAASPPEDDGEATVAMQIPQDLLDEAPKGTKKTIMGHPGVSPRTASAVRGGGKAPRRNETLAMDTQNVRRAAAQLAAQAGDDDEDEATQAMNVDAMLAQIDAHSSPPPPRRAPAPAPRRAPAPAPAEDEDEATQAMNVDDMLAQIDDRPPARPAPRRAARAPVEAVEDEENESTMAVDMDAMLAEIDAPPTGGGDEDEKTQAMDISMLDDIDMAPPKPRRAAPEPEYDPEPIGGDDDWAAAAAAAEVEVGVEALPAAVDGSGFVGSMRYALAFDGRQAQLDEQLVAIDSELQVGGGRSRTELNRLKQQYEAERASMDAGKAKTGWIMLGAIGGGLGVVLLIIGLI